MPDKLMRRIRLSLAILAVLLVSAAASEAQVLAPNLVYTAVKLCRVFDTRSSTAGPLIGGVRQTFNVIGGNVTPTTFTGQGGTSGGCSIPGFAASFIGNFPQVQAVVIKLMAMSPSTTGNLAAWPSDQPAPGWGVMLYSSGTSIANTVVVPVRQDSQGADVTLQASGTTDAVGDVMGYFSNSSSPVGGPFNVALGGAALGSVTTAANDNVAIGSGALGSLRGGTSNVAVGFGAGTNYSGNENSNVVIASLGQAADAGTIRIGNSHDHSSAYVAGISGVTSSAGTAVYINANGQLGTATSALRFKEEVQDMDDASQGLMRLRPVTFHYRPQYDDGSQLLQYGLIAEEVARIYPGLVQYDGHGQPLAVRYQFVDAMLLNEVQRQHRKIDDQQAKIEELERQVRVLLEQRKPGQAQ
jgi:hypothetical protein